MCLTFATVAETAYSMGHREHAERTLASAEKGYSDMLRFFSQAKGMTAEVEKELRSKFRHLRERLDGLHATQVRDDEHRLVVQNDIQQRTVDFQATVVVNESELAESVHEKVDS